MSARLARWALAAMFVTGCARTSAPANPPPPPADPGPAPGGDRDPHGCIPSTGLVWCARESRCAAPWEIMRAHGALPDGGVDPASFGRYCNGP